jgi:phosphinothricin acetyltransferase
MASPVPNPVLRTPVPSPAARTHARLATPDDGPACAAIYAPYVADTSISFELVPPDGAEMGARIARTIARTPWVVVEVDGVVRAYAYATRHRERPAYDWTVETAVYVDRDFARQGLGRIAMQAVLAILRLQGAHLVVAGITLPNEGSVELHLRLGFERIGGFEAIGWKRGAWHGVDWFALELGPRSDEPAPLVPLPQIAGTAALEAALASENAQGQAIEPTSSG